MNGIHFLLCADYSTGQSAYFSAGQVWAVRAVNQHFLDLKITFTD